MSDDRKREAPPLAADCEGPLADQGWHGGATFFSESGGRSAIAAGAENNTGGRADPHLPASESGAGVIPEDEGGDAGATHVPASEADSAPLQEDTGERQSWPGKSFGSILPPG